MQIYIVVFNVCNDKAIRFFTVIYIFKFGGVKHLQTEFIGLLKSEFTALLFTYDKYLFLIALSAEFSFLKSSVKQPPPFLYKYLL